MNVSQDYKHELRMASDSSSIIQLLAALGKEIQKVSYLVDSGFLNFSKTPLQA